MIESRNASGRPLSSDTWLEAHHKAKLPERLRFGQRIALMNPSSIVDIGCGTGLWLDLLDQILPSSCVFYGIDTDGPSVDKARERSKSWRRSASISQANVNDELPCFPSGCLYLCFNIFGYVQDIDQLIGNLQKSGNEACSIAIRQYDGSLMRFGPMMQANRNRIDGSLTTAVEASDQFKHYVMDRVIAAIARSSFKSKIIEFESFYRMSPFSSEVEKYLSNTIDWSAGIIDHQSHISLKNWLEASRVSSEFYVLETDLVSILS